jgi:uncharacterized repeat protein (TIGR01451 family)
LVEWKITVANRGPSTALDVIVKDVLPKGLQLVDVRGGNYNNDTHEWTIGTLNSGRSVSIVLVTKVLTNGTIKNPASVNTSVEESNYTNNNASNTTKAKYVCDLAITKSVNCTSCYVSDLVKWNITVVNHGPHNASNVIVKDILPKGLKLINYEVSVGNFNEVISEWSIGTLEKDTPVSLILVTKVLIDGTFVNIATVNTTTPDSNYTNNIANNTTRADPICDLVISKTVNATKVYVGNTVRWTIKVTNNGPSSASNVKVRDILPDGLKLLRNKTSQGRYQNGVWTVGTLKKGSSAVIILITEVTDAGYITNPASVRTSTHESNYKNNKANDTTRGIRKPVPVSDLAITKSVNATKVIKGDYVRWTIRVTNNGPNAASNVKVRDILPDGLKLVRNKTSQGRYQNGVWTVGRLNNGSSATIVLITKTTKAGNITNIASVNSSTKDPNKTNNRANNSTEVREEPACDLVLYKLSDKKKYNVNDTMHWIIKVVNKGPDGAINTYVRDVLPDSTEFVSYTSSKGSFNKTNGVWRIGDLAKGEEVILVITCKILSPGNITNKAIVNSSVKDTNDSNNRDNVTIEVTEEIPIPNPPEPNKPNLSLKTGNPLVGLLIAFLTMFGVIGFRCRKE